MARVYVGTSGFSYKEWKPRFYPEGLPDRQMLEFYASKFNSVEIDSTFYRMPALTTLEAWQQATPDNFKFVLKAPQQLTHRQRLRVPSEALNRWVSTIPALGNRLAFAAYQLPPFQKYDFDKLQLFLESLPSNHKKSFEFRHSSWFVPEVFDLLRNHQAILCIHDTDDGCSPMELTSTETCVRLRKSAYSPLEREEWRDRFRKWSDSGIDVFAFVKHKDNPDAPLIALDFAEGF